MTDRQFDRPSDDRGGGAMTALLGLLPIVLLTAIGSLEAANHLFLRQSLQAAAHEAAVVAAKAGARESDARAAADAVLRSRRVRGAEVTLTDLTGATQFGDTVIVKVAAPTGSNSVLAGRWIGDRTVTASRVMPKE